MEIDYTKTRYAEYPDIITVRFETNDDIDFVRKKLKITLPNTKEGQAHPLLTITNGFLTSNKGKILRQVNNKISLLQTTAQDESITTGQAEFCDLLAKTLKLSLDKRLNKLDTADLQKLGISEGGADEVRNHAPITGQVAGKALKGKRRRTQFIADKEQEGFRGKSLPQSASEKKEITKLAVNILNETFQTSIAYRPNASDNDYAGQLANNLKIAYEGENLPTNEQANKLINNASTGAKTEAIAKAKAIAKAALEKAQQLKKGSGRPGGKNHRGGGWFKG